MRISHCDHGPACPVHSESVAERLEYLRSQIDAEQISYGELAELQGLAEHIDPSDVQLLEAAGVPEHPTDWNEDFDPQTLDPMFKEPTLVDLERQALKAANWRGHTMSPYQRTSSHQSYATCTKCGRGAYCDTKPMPNGIDIHGEAVALNCSD